MPEGWVGFCDAGGVFDEDVGAAEADDCEAHGHAVVVVGVELDGGGGEGHLPFGGRDGHDIVVAHDGAIDFDVELGEFVAERFDAVGFFDAECAQAAEDGHPGGEAGDGGEGHRGVGHGGEVGHDGFERAGAGGHDEVIALIGFFARRERRVLCCGILLDDCAHARKERGEAGIALE